MIKILKEGRRDPPPPKYKQSCTCGCLFTAEESDVEYGPAEFECGRTWKSAHLSCPNCEQKLVPVVSSEWTTWANS